MFRPSTQIIRDQNVTSLQGGGAKVFWLHSRKCEPHLFSHLRTNISYFPACVRISFLYYVSYLKLGEILPCPEANIFHKTSDPSPTQHGDSKVLITKALGKKSIIASLSQVFKNFDTKSMQNWFLQCFLR